MSYVHDDQHGSLLGRGVRDRAVLLGCSWAAEMSDEPIILSRCCPTCERLTAENAALRKDAEARSLYDRTAAAHGFANAPHWNDLAEETRQMYRDERAKRDAAP
jgi:hypothetical protein